MKHHPGIGAARPAAAVGAPRRDARSKQAFRLQEQLRPGVAPAGHGDRAPGARGSAARSIPDDRADKAPASHRPQPAASPCSTAAPADHPAAPPARIKTPIATKLPLQHPNNSPASARPTTPRSQRSKTLANFCILRSSSHSARPILAPRCYPHQEAQQNTGQIVCYRTRTTKKILDYLATAFPERAQPGGWKNPFTGR